MFFSDRPRFISRFKHFILNTVLNERVYIGERGNDDYNYYAPPLGPLPYPLDLRSEPAYLGPNANGFAGSESDNSATASDSGWVGA